MSSASGFPTRELPRAVVAALVRVSWLAVRWPLLAFLVILEPVIRVLLAGSALLLTLTALFYALVRPAAEFPFWGMVGVSSGLVLTLTVYYAMIRVLSV